MNKLICYHLCFEYIDNGEQIKYKYMNDSW